MSDEQSTSEMLKKQPLRLPIRERYVDVVRRVVDPVREVGPA